jgi:hypothetical protein
VGIASTSFGGRGSLARKLTIVVSLSVTGMVHKYRSGVVVSATTIGSIHATSLIPKMDRPSTSADVMVERATEVFDISTTWVVDGWVVGWMDGWVGTGGTMIAINENVLMDARDG